MAKNTKLTQFEYLAAFFEFNGSIRFKIIESKKKSFKSFELQVSLKLEFLKSRLDLYNEYDFFPRGYSPKNNKKKDSNYTILIVNDSRSVCNFLEGIKEHLLYENNQNLVKDSLYILKMELENYDNSIKNFIYCCELAEKINKSQQFRTS